MDDNVQKQDSLLHSDKEQETAVPYIPPSPLEEPQQKKFRSPLVNAIIFVVIILFGGFMTYNYVSHQLTQISSASIVNNATPTPSIIPTSTPTP